MLTCATLSVLMVAVHALLVTDVIQQLARDCMYTHHSPCLTNTCLNTTTYSSFSWLATMVSDSSHLTSLRVWLPLAGGAHRIAHWSAVRVSLCTVQV